MTPPVALPAGRDLTLDLARVVCVLLVVIVHLLFTGVAVVDGAITVERTAELQPWFPVASWLGQVMPLFFVVGGFASITGWRSAQRRGDTAADFVRVRLARLARPALPIFVLFTLALGVATLIGVDPAFLDTVAVGVGSPLWFLAAYMLVQALAPWMISLHERRPVVTLVALVALAIVTDAARFGSGELLVGLPNVAFVWLAVQQIGFWMADGWFKAKPLWLLALVVVAGYLVLLPVIEPVGYSWNMLSNQYPPTVPLIVLGVVEAAALTLLHRPLSELMSTRPAQALVFVLGSRLMTLYLWHLPVILALVGIQLLLPIPMSLPASAAWWWERIPAFLLVLAVVWSLSLVLVRFERLPQLAAPPRAPALAVAVAAFVAPPALIMVLGLDLPLAIAGVVGTALALALGRISARPVASPARSGPRQAASQQVAETT